MVKFWRHKVHEKETFSRWSKIPSIFGPISNFKVKWKQITLFKEFWRLCFQKFISTFVILALFWNSWPIAQNAHGWTSYSTVFVHWKRWQNVKSISKKKIIWNNPPLTWMRPWSEPQQYCKLSAAVKDDENYVKSPLNLRRKRGCKTQGSIAGFLSSDKTMEITWNWHQMSGENETFNLNKSVLQAFCHQRPKVREIAIEFRRKLGLALEPQDFLLWIMLPWTQRSNSPAGNYVKSPPKLLHWLWQVTTQFGSISNPLFSH